MAVDVRVQESLLARTGWRGETRTRLRWRRALSTIYLNQPANWQSEHHFKAIATRPGNRVWFMFKQ